MKKIVFFVFLIFSSSLFAQKEANIWYFGLAAGIDFNSGEAVALRDSYHSFVSGGSASISTASGELLFYTDGYFVFNKNHLLMPNGAFLGGDSSSTQPAIIVPKPGNSNLYYIFTTTSLARNEGLRYSEVDMRLNGGLGDVTVNKSILLATPITEKITAIKSGGFNGYWIIAHKWNSDKFLVYKVTTSGVDTSPLEYTIGSFVSGDVTNAQGQLKLSPNGKKLAIVHGGKMNNLQLFDFDFIAGKISNPNTIIDTDENKNIYGVEFSPDGKLLYVSGQKNGLYQFNLDAGSISDIIDSKYTVVETRIDDFFSLQLAPDGRIYIAKNGSDRLDYFETPNNIGLGSGYNTYHSIYNPTAGFYLDGGRSGKGFPQFIQSYFFVGFLAENLCFRDTTKFTANISESYDSISWDFGDGNASNEENPTHTYNQAGRYSVTLSVTSGSNTSVETQEIIIYKTPTATKPSDLLPCDTNNDGFHNFNLTTQSNAILNGQLSTEFEVAYFASMLDYTNDTNISDATSYQNTTAYQEQTIIARVRNKQNSDCEAITQFKIQVFESPTPKLAADIPNLSFCDTTSVGTDTDGKIIFNLTDRATAILNGQSTTNFLVSYFLDEDLTQPITNETNYTNLTATQRIYAKVENKTNATCFAKTSFLLEVFELPIINSPVSLKQCDNSDINGFSAFNLNEAKSKIVTNPDAYTITFFEEKALAESNTSPIPTPTNYTNQVVSNDTVWARIENNNSCYRVIEVNLIVSTTQIPDTFLKSFYECDDGTDTTDGIATFNFSAVTDDIKDLFPSNQQLIIKYYRNEADGLSELNEITTISNYQNIGYANQQEIYVRVDSELDNDCLGLGHHITLNVEKVPVANSVTINPECDNDRDGFYAFDTSTIQNTLIGKQTNVAVSYFDKNNVQLSSPLPNPFITASQTITARIISTNSQDLDGPCFDEITIDFIVNSVPIANRVHSQEQCDDDTDGIIGFDVSSIEATVLGGQTGLIVKYFDENDVALPNPLPNPFFTASQTIKVRLENPIYDVCYEETTVDFIVREKPTFDLIDEDIICMTNTPELDLEIENPNENNNTYTWTDENNTIVSNLPTATVTKGGIYKVIATSIYGCISEEHKVRIKESSISTLNINDIEVVDDSANNSIQINISNLGLGDYEFRLLDEDLVLIRNYQDDPFFDTLEGGIYTIEVNDKNGCGSILFEVSLLSFPKFFTPNGDGRNDFWQINGISNNFYQSGTIKIFNRYGNLMNQFTIDDIGWDGTYNGNVLPSNDYWFYVELLDKKNSSRTRSGHFSLLRK
jgi:gliding motility-associated-like protein